MKTPQIVHLTLGALLFAAPIAACRSDVLLGNATDSSLETHDASLNGCGGKSCGASCIINGCNGRVGCANSDLAGYCDADGQCSVTRPACTPYVACDDASLCGDPCWPCDVSRGDCEPSQDAYSCTKTHKCLPGEAKCECVGVDCPPPQPCQDAACGEPCACDHADDADCPDSDLPKFCDGNNHCLTVEQVACPHGYKPCENKVCGEGCSPCKDPASCDAQGTFVCNAYGVCSTAPTTCVVPCDPSRCGEACTPCEPTNPGCVLAPAFCDKHGACTVGDAPTFCPCKDLGCGDACSFCDPSDPMACSAAEDDAGSRVCDDLGACVPSDPGAACP